jgi:hypothetical protein
MSLGVLILVLVLGLAGCSTRNMVVQPDEVPKLNDSKWTITSPPSPRPR